MQNTCTALSLASANGGFKCNGIFDLMSCKNKNKTKTKKKEKNEEHVNRSDAVYIEFEMFEK